MTRVPNPESPRLTRDMLVHAIDKLDAVEDRYRQLWSFMTDEKWIAKVVVQYWFDSHEKWLQENCRGQYDFQKHVTLEGVAVFTDERDAVLFKLFKG